MKTMFFLKKSFGLIIPFLVIFLGIMLSCDNGAKGKEDKSLGLEKQEKKHSLMLPDFSLRDLDGKEYRLFDYIGKNPMLLVFWTTRCSFCIKEIPRLNKIFSEHKNRLDILSIDINEPPRQVKYLADSKGIQYPILLDLQGETAFDYHIRGVPTFIVIDLSGGMRYYGHDLDEAMKKVTGLIGG